MKPMKKRNYKQGYYELVYPEKYLQPLDKTMNKQILPQYRSSWELKFFKFWYACPLNDSPGDTKRDRQGLHHSEKSRNAAQARIGIFQPQKKGGYSKKSGLSCIL